MRVLLVDDDFLIVESLKICLRDKFQITSVGTFDEAIKCLDSQEFDGAVFDIHLADGTHDGIELLTVARQKHPDLPIVMMSGENAASTIVKCMQLGADDYLEKPLDADSLCLRLGKTFRDNRKNRVFKRAFEIVNSKNQIVGSSPGIDNAKTLVEKSGRMRILFHGETGVGKTPFAWYSNQVVSREEGQPRPFEQINCAGLTKEHFQDQLFGHKKGAFTGAISDKRGLVEIAKGGDLFLDEIGEMPLDTQALFLTFIDSQEYYRLGDDQKRRAEVRILCATNRDLRTMVAEGSFRKDLYSRIAQVVVSIPPLRSHPSDIPELVEHFVKTFSGYRKPVSKAVINRLVQHGWQDGNVRELRDAIEYACIVGRDSESLGMEHLPERLNPNKSSGAASETDAGNSEDWLKKVAEQGLEKCLGTLERRILDYFVREYGGVTDDLTKVLRVSKPTLYRRLKQYDISATVEMQPYEAMVMRAN